MVPRQRQGDIKRPFNISKLEKSIYHLQDLLDISDKFFLQIVIDSVEEEAEEVQFPQILVVTEFQQVRLL